MALPDYSGGSGFYDPQKTYTSYLQPQYPAHNIMSGQGMDPYLYRNYVTNEDPQNEYRRRLAAMGLGGLGSRAQTLQGLYSDVKSGYGQAMIGSNVDLNFNEFLDQTNLADQFNNMSYEQQGYDPNRFGSGKYRWGQRPG